MQKPENVPLSPQEITWALLVMLMTFKLSDIKFYKVYYFSGRSKMLMYANVYWKGLQTNSVYKSLCLCVFLCVNEGFC